MRALFGESQDATQDPAGMSTRHVKSVERPSQPCTWLQATDQNVLLSPGKATEQPQSRGQSLLCITNKRPAPPLNQSWPNKSRQSAHAHPCLQHTNAFDDLELEASVSPSPTVSFNSRACSGQSNAILAASSHCTQAIRSSSAVNRPPDSQATEQWHSAYSQQRLQASQASLQALTAHQKLPGPCKSGISAAEDALPRHLPRNKHVAMVHYVLV